MKETGTATKLIQGGRPQTDPIAPLTVPIYGSTTFVFESAAEVQRHAEGHSERYLYSRYGNPTVAAVESSVALLEGAAAARLVASGMAATATALLTFLESGDEVVCAEALYGGMAHLLRGPLAKLGIRTHFASLEELRAPESLFGDRTRLLWFESPTNPTLRCLDLRHVATACRSRGVLSIIDNTFATPINQQPLSLGIDLSMHSATKYLNGHSDVTGGAVAGPAELIERIDASRKLLGTVLDPGAAYALGRGLKTLAVRVAQHNANALKVARFLESDHRVERTLYPGLPSHPEHELARSQMSGYGGMVCFELEGGLDRAARFFDRLQVFQRAASLGGVESVCSLPVLTSHWGYTSAALTRAGVSAGMVRLSVGLEDHQDLIADLDQALG